MSGFLAPGVGRHVADALTARDLDRSQQNFAEAALRRNAAYAEARRLYLSSFPLVDPKAIQK